MSLTSVNFTTIPAASGVQHSLSALSQSPTLQQRNYTVIDPKVPGNRLYETENGEVALVPKTPAEIAGEKFLRPLLDKVHSLFNSPPVKTLTSAVTSGASFVRSACVRFDRAFSFPVARAESETMKERYDRVQDELAKAIADPDATERRGMEALSDGIEKAIELLEGIKKDLELEIDQERGPQTEALTVEEELSMQKMEKVFADMRRSLEQVSKKAKAINSIALAPCKEEVDPRCKNLKQRHEAIDRIKLDLEDATSFVAKPKFLVFPLRLEPKETLRSDLEKVNVFLKKLKDHQKNELFFGERAETTPLNKVGAQPKDDL